MIFILTITPIVIIMSPYSKMLEDTTTVEGWVCMTKQLKPWCHDPVFRTNFVYISNYQLPCGWNGSPKFEDCRYAFHLCQLRFFHLCCDVLGFKTSVYSAIHSILENLKTSVSFASNITLA